MGKFIVLLLQLKPVRGYSILSNFAFKFCECDCVFVSNSYDNWIEDQFVNIYCGI